MQFPNESKFKRDQCNELKESNELNQLYEKRENEDPTSSTHKQIQMSESENENEAIETAIRVGNYSSAISVSFWSFFHLIRYLLAENKQR